MFDFLRRKSRSMGSVLFRGSLPIPFENFGYLSDRGIELEPRPSDPDCLWAARARHPVWGEAELTCARASPPPPRELLEFDPRLMESEVDAISTCASSVQVTMSHEQRNVLRERKLALRMMHAVMGEHGVSAVDHGSQRFWSRPCLEEELAHDADLDIDSLFILHAVRPDGEEDGRVEWLHSHGLGELGFFDFDILQPSSEVVDGSTGLIRAIAFGIVEERIGAESDEVWIAEPGGRIRMVPAGMFQRCAAAKFTALRDDPEESHRVRRSVVCEPGKGFLSKLFGDRIEPSRWLREPIDENMIIGYSSDATALMAQRARDSYTLCRRYADEFRDLEVKVLCKIGLPVDGSTEEENDREHLWFEATALADEQVTGTLLNQPWHIAKLVPGETYSYGLDALSDWTVFTPAGRITPAEGVAVRRLRENRDAILEAMREAGGGES